MTTETLEPRTLSERYAHAIGVGGPDLDVIHAAAAAALSRFPFGVLLLRLQAEYDAARSALERAGQIAERGEAALRQVEALHAGVDALPLAASARRRADLEVMTARCLVYQQMPSLREVRAVAEARALRKARRRNLGAPGDVVLRLAARALDVWLDPVCSTCDGTGHSAGGYDGRPAVKCSACGGTGHRRSHIGNDEATQWFGFLLLGDLQREMAAAAGLMAAKLRAA